MIDLGHYYRRDNIFGQTFFYSPTTDDPITSVILPKQSALNLGDTAHMPVIGTPRLRKARQYMLVSNLTHNIAMIVRSSKVLKHE